MWTGGRLFGRLLSPQVEWNPAEDGNPASGGELSLHFSRVVPTRPTAVATDVGAHSQQHPLAQREGEALRLPVDKPFTEQSLRVQVFGRQPAGGSFAAPHAFQAEGRDLAAALNVQRQWQEYQQRHQTARASAGQPVSKANFAHSSTLAVQSGESWRTCVQSLPMVQRAALLLACAEQLGRLSFASIGNAAVVRQFALI